MVDLSELAARLDAEERLKVKYRFRSPDRFGRGSQWTERMGKLLDVEESTRTIFVSQDGEAIWITAEEAMEILPDDGVYA